MKKKVREKTLKNISKEKTKKNAILSGKKNSKKTLKPEKKKKEIPNSPVSIEKIKEEKVKNANDFVWTKEMSVNDPTIDKQHRGLFESFKKLSKDSNLNWGIAGTRETLHFIFNYIKEHFSYEEEYMKKIKFPDIENHKKIHKSFIKEYEKYQNEFKKIYSHKENLSANLSVLGEKMRIFLGKWWMNHILVTDQKYAQFVEEKNKKEEKKPEKKSSKKEDNEIDLASIKREIEAELESGKIEPHQAEILEQRAPIKKTIDKLKDKNKKVNDKYIKTGISGLDALFENGIPKGSAVLIAGGAGSGKTISCLQTLVYNASQGEKCFYMSFEESEDRLKQHMADFGWDAEKLIKAGKLKLSRTSPFDITRNVDALLAKEKGELLIEVDPIILPKNFKPDFVVVDSLTAIASAFTGKEDSYRIYIEQLFRFFEQIGATTFLITETKQIPEIFSTTGVEEFLADGVIVFYNFKRGDVRENAVEVLKMRGEKHQKKIVAMAISNNGITIYPEQEVFGFENES